MKTHLTESDYCPACSGSGERFVERFVNGDSCDTELCSRREPCPHCHGTCYDPEKVDVEGLAKHIAEFRAAFQPTDVVERRNGEKLFGLKTRDDKPGCGCGISFWLFIKQENEG